MPDDDGLDPIELGLAMSLMTEDALVEAQTYVVFAAAYVFGQTPRRILEAMLQSVTPDEEWLVKVMPEWHDKVEEYAHQQEEDTDV